MALITCPECGKQISDQAEACPNCGYPISVKIEQEKVCFDESKIQESEKICTEGSKEVDLSDSFQKETKSRKKAKTAMIIAGSIIVFAIAIIIFLFVYTKGVREAKGYADELIGHVETLIEATSKISSTTDEDRKIVYQAQAKAASTLIGSTAEKYFDALKNLNDRQQEEVRKYLYSRIEKSELYEEYLYNIFEDILD